MTARGGGLAVDEREAIVERMPRSMYFQNQEKTKAVAVMMKEKLEIAEAQYFSELAIQ